ncbi:hypothetical protein [Streptomyces recifensis]|nr:hypothetical protein [Streptomyces recifensis]
MVGRRLIAITRLGAEGRRTVSVTTRSERFELWVLRVGEEAPAGVGVVGAAVGEMGGDWDKLKGLLIFILNLDELRIFGRTAPNGTRIIVLPAQPDPPAGRRPSAVAGPDDQAWLRGLAGSLPGGIVAGRRRRRLREG